MKFQNSRNNKNNNNNNNNDNNNKKGNNDPYAKKKKENVSMKLHHPVNNFRSRTRRPSFLHLITYAC